MSSAPLLSSIPSPSENIIHLGPVPLHMYGLMLAIGVLVAVRVAEVRWVRRGHGAKEFSDLVVWIVVAGVIGARVYHVVTDYELFTHDWIKAFYIWQGGLGIWGAVIGGAIAAIVLARRRHLDLGDLLDSIAPGLVFAQAMGRWGNWFNQELFGAPTTLPWGLEIDPAKRPFGYRQYATFQPTFLYESLYCFALGLALIWIDHHLRLKKFQLFALYCMGYTAARLVFEEMRIDPAHTIGPLRLNAWVSIAVFLSALAWFLWLRRHGTPVEWPEPDDGGAAAISPSDSQPESA
ncbi:MAG: prolipoprotein diacylglyceryl transferase [Acidimicrobiia bacterium]